MTEADPHAGKTPGLGCGCDRCKEPHTIGLQVIEPGTPEHDIWAKEQDAKRRDSDRLFNDRGDQIGRPKFWMRG